MLRSARGTLTVVVAALALVALPMTGASAATAATSAFAPAQALPAVHTAAAAPVASDYQLTPLPIDGTLGGYTPTSVVGGVVVGTHGRGQDLDRLGWVWKNGTLTNLPASDPSWITTIPNQISAGGLIQGVSFPIDANQSTTGAPVLWRTSAPGTPLTVTPPAGPTPLRWSGYGVNASGASIWSEITVNSNGSWNTVPYYYSSLTGSPQVIAGAFDTTIGSNLVGLTNSGSILVQATPVGGVAGSYLLPTPDATPAQSVLLDFLARVVSPNGTIVGTRAITSSTLDTIVRLPSGVETKVASNVFPNGVLDDGTVIGTLVQNEVPTGVLVKDGVITTIDSLVPGWTYTGARAIDDQGDIVGTGTNPSGTIEGFILTRDASSKLSTSLSISPASPHPGERAIVTATISNTGSIEATGITATLTGTPSQNLSIGTPTPASVASLAGGATKTVTWSFVAGQADHYALSAGLHWSDAASSARTGSADLAVVVAEEGIVVNSSGDAPQSPNAITDKACDSDDSAAGLQCTLRAAIQLANQLGSATTQSISFNIPGDGTPTIAPTSALPALVVPATIDGTSQASGWVHLSGASAPDNGLILSGGGTTLRGFVLNGFAHGAAVVLNSGSHDVIAGNRIGTDQAGATAVPNQNGILLGAPDTVIGGASGQNLGACTGDCNVISGNTLAGVLAFNREQFQPEYQKVKTFPARSRIQGNVIGTDATGSRAVGNQLGVYVTTTTEIDRADEVVIGGATSSPGRAPGNLVSGNDTGIKTYGPLFASVVSGNLVGTDATGTRAVANSAGISDGTPNDTIGGTTSQEGNVVGGNGVGVVLGDASQGVAAGGYLLGNRIGLGLGSAVVPNGTGVSNFGGLLCDNTISGNGTGVSAADDATRLGGGNRIGTDPSGSFAVPNGVGVEGSAGSVSNDLCLGSGRDLVSGNTGPAFLEGTNSSKPVRFYLSDIYIGTDLTGTRAIPNASGIAIEDRGGADTYVGTYQLGVGRGALSATGPVKQSCSNPCVIIAGNRGDAISVRGSTSSSSTFTMHNTWIGVASDGSPMGNAGDGIRIAARLSSQNGISNSRIENNAGIGIEDSSSSAATVMPVTSTTIAANPGGGVLLADGGGFQFRGDVIHDGAFGIKVTEGTAPELQANSIYANQLGYQLLFSTQSIGIPAQVTAVRTGRVITIRGSQPIGEQTSYRIDAYGDSALTCRISGQGQFPLSTHVLPTAFVGGDFGIQATEVPAAVAGIEVTATDTSSSRVGITGRYSDCLTPTVVTAQASASATTAQAGSSITVTGSGFAPGESVDVTLHSDPIHLGTLVADADGSVSAQVGIPASVPAGAHRVILTGVLSGSTATIGLTVVVAARLANTGVDPLPLAALAALFLIAGWTAKRHARVRR